MIERALRSACEWVDACLSKVVVRQFEWQNDFTAARNFVAHGCWPKPRRHAVIQRCSAAARTHPASTHVVRRTLGRRGAHEMLAVQTLGLVIPAFGEAQRVLLALAAALVFAGCRRQAKTDAMLAGQAQQA